MPQVSEYTKVQIITRVLEDHWSIRRAANHFGVDKNTILRWKNRWIEQHTTRRKQGTGLTKISSEQQDEALVNHLRQNPFTTCAQASAASMFPGSRQTAQRRIRKSNLKCRVAARKPFLTEEHKQARVIFAANHILEGNDFWERVVFTDEKIFKSTSDRRKFLVYRPENSRFDPQYTHTIKNSGRFSLNMWGWFSARGLGVFWRIDGRFNSEKYIDILNDVMLPSVALLHEENFIYQQDNCPVHTANVVETWFRDRNIQVLPWPSNSPDINPIENIWGRLVKIIYQRNWRPRNAEELSEAIERALDILSEEEHYFQNLSYSMPRRLQLVLDNNGEPIKY